MINEHMIMFVQFATRLRVEDYLPEVDDAMPDQEKVIAALTSCQRTNDELIDDNDEITKIINTLPPLNPNTHKKRSKIPTELTFEKDDDSNGHINFITAASNLRALNYNIPPSTPMETRRIAGHIIPAMITTTAFVSALQTIELLKYTQKKKPQERELQKRLKRRRGGGEADKARRWRG